MPIDTQQRASNWQITIYDTKEVVANYKLPPGWKLTGQWETCPTTGRLHLQGLLKTPQVRWSTIKNQFPTHHFEVVRNLKAMENYNDKAETREGEFKGIESPNVFMMQEKVCKLWDATVWAGLVEQEMKKKMPDMGDAALRYVDTLVSKLIEDGTPGAEFAGVNPMWRSSWKRFYKAILVRWERQTDRQTSAVESIEETPPAGEWNPMDPPSPLFSNQELYGVHSQATEGGETNGTQAIREEGADEASEGRS